MNVKEIRHPLIRHKLGLMRRSDISTKNFRELAQEVAALLTYEATQDMAVEEPRRHDVERPRDRAGGRHGRRLRPAGHEVLGHPVQQ